MTIAFGAGVDQDGRVFVAARDGDRAVDVGQVLPDYQPLMAGNLDRFLAAGPSVWQEVIDAVRPRLTGGGPLPRTTMPFTVADYVDFYACEQHAANAGRIFRPDADPLYPNWKHLPVGYHGRAGTVVPDGATIRRPQGLRGPSDFGPTLRLDFEAELGFVVGVPAPGGRVPVAAFADHVFGVCVVNDWSARDIQRFETVPLGPFLGKSFATSISDWIVPLAELADVRCDPPAHEQAPAGYLRDDQPWALDLGLTVHINDVPVANDLPVRELYWTGAQMLAHMTVNGAGLRTGDLYASGTVSGEHAQGCLLELTWGGRQTIEVGPMSRTWLEDGDTVTVSAPRLGLRTSGTVAG